MSLHHSAQPGRQLPTLPGDVDHLVLDDHLLVRRLFEHLENGRGNRRTLADQVSYHLALHTAAEESVVYPELKATGDGELAQQALHEHREIKESLIVVEHSKPGSDEFEAALARVIAEFRGHAAEEEAWLDRLRSRVGPERMAELGESFVRLKRTAPGHTHLSALPVNKLLGPVAAFLDLLRDEASGRLDRLATDASGLLDPQAQSVVDAFSRLHPRPLETLRPTQARRQPTMADAFQAVLKAQNRLTAALPIGQIEKQIIRSGGVTVPVRIYHPIQGGPGGLPVLVYAHGGGVVGHPDRYEASAIGLANRTEAIVVSVDYRRAPERPFPAAHDDVEVITRWVMSLANLIGGDVSRVAIAGEYVGANMAASTCRQLNTARGPRPLMQVLICPITTGRQDSDSCIDSADASPLNRPTMSWCLHHLFRDSELAITDRRFDLLASPIGELSGLPPAVVITADRDPLRSQGEEYAANLRRAGVPVVAERFAGMPHDFFGMAGVVDQADRAQQLAADELKRIFDAPSPAGLTG